MKFISAQNSAWDYTEKYNIEMRYYWILNDDFWNIMLKFTQFIFITGA